MTGIFHGNGGVSNVYTCRRLNLILILLIYRTSQICILSLSLSRTHTHDMHASIHSGRADPNSPNNDCACGRAVAPQTSARRRCGAWPPVVGRYSRPACSHRGPRPGSHTRRQDGREKTEKEKMPAGPGRPRPMRLFVGAGSLCVHACMHTYIHTYIHT